MDFKYAYKLLIILCYHGQFSLDKLKMNLSSKLLKDVIQFLWPTFYWEASLKILIPRIILKEFTYDDGTVFVA